jgi:hypothetical protein
MSFSNSLVQALPLTLYSRLSFLALSVSYQRLLYQTVLDDMEIHVQYDLNPQPLPFSLSAELHPHSTHPYLCLSLLFILLTTWSILDPHHSTSSHHHAW